MNKKALREELKKKRGAIAPEKRKEAEKEVFHLLSHHLKAFKQVLSFASFGTEIDIGEINNLLAKEERLVLPRIENDEVICYAVSDTAKLIPSQWGILEPNPKTCIQVNPSELECVLVPGLGFDKRGHRIGYGKGHYDRFLTQYNYLYTVGVGFSEQLCDELPIEETDRALKALVIDRILPLVGV